MAYKRLFSFSNSSVSSVNVILKFRCKECYLVYSIIYKTSIPKLCVGSFQIIHHGTKFQDIIKFIALHLKQNNFRVSEHSIDAIIQSPCTISSFFFFFPKRLKKNRTKWFLEIGSSNYNRFIYRITIFSN